MLLELPDERNAVDEISSKTRNALRQYEIVFPALTGFDHTIEVVPVLKRRTGYALIGIDMTQVPIRMSTDELLVVLLL